MSDEKVKITVEAPFATANTRPVLGEQRLVPYLPIGLPGTKGLMKPCIWQSPYTFWDADLQAQARICLLLLKTGSADDPKPDIVAVRLPADAIGRFPTGPVEW